MLEVFDTLYDKTVDTKEAMVKKSCYVLFPGLRKAEKDYLDAYLRFVASGPEQFNKVVESVRKADFFLPNILKIATAYIESHSSETGEYSGVDDYLEKINTSISEFFIAPDNFYTPLTYSKSINRILSQLSTVVPFSEEMVYLIIDVKEVYDEHKKEMFSQIKASGKSTSGKKIRAPKNLTASQWQEFIDTPDLHSLPPEWWVPMIISKGVGNEK